MVAWSGMVGGEASRARVLGGEGPTYFHVLATSGHWRKRAGLDSDGRRPHTFSGGLPRITRARATAARKRCEASPAATVTASPARTWRGERSRVAIARQRRVMVDGAVPRGRGARLRETKARKMHVGRNSSRPYCAMRFGVHRSDERGRRQDQAVCRSPCTTLRPALRPRCGRSKPTTNSRAIRRGRTTIRRVERRPSSVVQREESAGAETGERTKRRQIDAAEDVPARGRGPSTANLAD